MKNPKNITRQYQIAGMLLMTSVLPVPLLADDFPPPGDLAKGAKAWAENCNRCHNVRGSTELSDEQWITTTFHMRVRAGLTGQETRDILTFLQATDK